MADKQQPESNATSDNNPSVPQRPDFCTRFCYCLFRILWILLVCIIVFVCLVILVLYILITPRSFKFHVTDARLTQFNYAANSTLRYDLFLNITASNPNKKLKIYYDVVQANAFYEGVRFSTTDVNMPWTSYLQDKKGKNQVSANFSGLHVMALDRDEFDEDNKEEVFPIDIKINFTIRFRLGNLQSGYYYPKATCELMVPLSSSGKTIVAFDPTKCEIDF
ncbi:hypothetical protein VNO77_15836 [Canavalia gladiata]|uniref:Late embryogenesis abundant protein LEA-2 subgroup domain-containing protein n=1 Tax=Canavalia gladiata TaxID=3824 RepID=A0AAN9QRJ9_CANGL